MSKPPREFVPRTFAGRIVLFIASIGAIATGSFFVSRWLQAPLLPNDDIATLTPAFFIFLIYPGSLLGTGCLGLLWSIAQPRWVASRLCRSVVELAFHIWVTTAVIIYGALAVAWWYQRHY